PKCHLSLLHQIKNLCIFAPNYAKFQVLILCNLTEEDEFFREIVYCRQMFKKSPGKSCSGTHMYQLYWDLTTTGNVTGVQHSIQIMMMEEITAKRCHLPTVKKLHSYKIKFLLPPT
ncbi:hypothetical protein Celaphus_00004297, partial [Cervus elaphus hippelaphus]